jgi:hypothetical protein
MASVSPEKKAKMQPHQIRTLVDWSKAVMLAQPRDITELYDFSSKYALLPTGSRVVGIQSLETSETAFAVPHGVENQVVWRAVVAIYLPTAAANATATVCAKHGARRNPSSS